MLKVLIAVVLLGSGAYIVKLLLPDIQRYLAIRAM